MKTHQSFKIFSILIAVFLLGCSKKENTVADKYYLRFKANGGEKNYTNVVCDYNFIKQYNEHLLFYIRGHELLGQSNSNSVLSIQIDSSITDDQENLTGINITPETYKANGDPTLYTLTCNYYPSEADNYTIHNKNFTLRIEHLDKKTAKGTFSGVLINDDTGNIINITDGVFNIKVNYNEI